MNATLIERRPEWILRLGQLRPWEIEEARAQVREADPQRRAHLIACIAERLEQLYPDEVKPAQLEALVHIATDVVAVFDGVKGAGALIDKAETRAPAAWTIFQRAVKGESFAALLGALDVARASSSTRRRVAGSERSIGPGFGRSDDIIGLAADVASAYIRRNSIAAGDLPGLIASVHRALTAVQPETQAWSAAGSNVKKPATPIEHSLTDDYLVCLEDGRKFKSLKRHLRMKYGLSPEEYRAKWGLPDSYPMVAPASAAARSSLIRKRGLGLKTTSRRESIA